MVLFRILKVLVIVASVAWFVRSCRPLTEPVSQDVGGGHIQLDFGGDISALSYAHGVGRLLVGGVANGTVRILDVRTWQEVGRYETPPGLSGIRAVALRPDGTQAAVGFSDRNVVVVNLTTNREVARLPNVPTGVLRYSADGATLFAAGDTLPLVGNENSVESWNVAKSVRVAGVALAVGVSANGPRAVIAEDGRSPRCSGRTVVATPLSWSR